MSGGRVAVYDTTLRDGTQAEGFVLMVEDKVRVAQKLDQLGVHFIEGGYPGSNPKDQEFYQRMKQVELKNSTLVAFGATHHPGRTPDNDPNLKELLASGCKFAAVVGKSWDRHVITQLKVELARNLELIQHSVAHLTQKGMQVFFDAEHFFDGLAHNPEYTLSALEAAVNGGAKALILCDTNGGALPPAVTEAVALVAGRWPQVQVGIHTHNDGELAVANALAGVAAGATQIQGTMGGMGERCGNANLASLIPTLQLKMGYQCLEPKRLGQLTETIRFVSEIANQQPSRFSPYVGTCAFSHKGGLHISAVEQDPSLYEHVSPEAVGNQRRYLLSDLAGKAAIISKARQWNLGLEPDDPRVGQILQALKERESEGYVYEVAEASLELYLHELLGEPMKYFELLGYRVTDHKDSRDPGPVSEATVMVLVHGRLKHTAAVGHGPVHALDRALRKALVKDYPQLVGMCLVDYKVRVLSSKSGTAARVRVLIESSDQKDRWGTVGVSFDVLEASWQALYDAIRHRLFSAGVV